MSQEAEARVFASTLASRGLHAALAYLNSRTPHRCTAIYRYDGPTMASVMLYDRMEPAATRGIDVAVADAYCAQVAQRGQPFEFRDTTLLARGDRRARNPVVCYCGVLIPDGAGVPWGTLCHYDFQPCQMRRTDIPLLQAVAPLLYEQAAAEAEHG